MIVSFFSFLFFFYRSFQVSEHRCQMKIDEARTLVQTSSCLSRVNPMD